MSSRLPPLAVEEVGQDLGGGEKWSGVVLGLDGCLYGIPYNANRVVKFDPSDNSCVFIGGDLGNEEEKWCGAVMSPEGIIYGIPCNARKFLKIDPVNGTTSFIDLGDYAEDYADENIYETWWMSGALAPDGCVYCMPSCARRILRFDTINETISCVGRDMGDGDFKFNGTVVGNDGCIYGIPSHDTQVVKYDPMDMSTTFIGSNLGDLEWKWIGGIKAPDSGNIYLVPSESDHIHCINTSEQSVSRVGEVLEGDYKWDGGAIGEDGYLYFAPALSRYVLRFDPVNQSITLLEPQLPQRMEKWSSGILAHDGHIYFVPCISRRFLHVNTRTSMDNLHRLLKRKLWGNVIHLLKDTSFSDEIKRETLEQKNTDNHNTLLAALKLKAPVEVIKCIVEGNYNALVERDSLTGLFPLMSAAVGEDSDLGVVYELFHFHPGLIHEYLGSNSVNH